MFSYYGACALCGRSNMCVRLRLYLASCLGGSNLCSLCVGSDAIETNNSTIKLHNFSVGCKAEKIK